MEQKHADKYRIIGQTIKKYRKLKNLTQEQLADKASISISYLTKIEALNCDQPFSLEVILDISEVLDCTELSIDMFNWFIADMNKSLTCIS